MPNDSLPGMVSVDAKIDRAKEHLRVFQEEAAVFINSQKRQLWPKVDPKTSQAWLVLQINNPWPPLRLSTIAGDCIFNIRSALDNLVCALVRTVKPKSTCSSRQFPIYTEQWKWQDHAADHVRGVPPEAKAIIEKLQPYNRGKAEAARDPLSILNTLSNRDKHRSVHFTTSYNRNVQFIVYGDGGNILCTFSVEHMILDQPVQTIPLGQISSEPQGHMSVRAKGTTLVVFEDESLPVVGEPVDAVLATCLQYIENSVIAQFKPFFENSGGR